MKFIITGGCGFIGSSFVHLISRLGHEYKVIDKLTYAGDQTRLPKGYYLLVKDICKLTEEDLGEYDYIVNFAAESHVDNSIKDGKPFIDSNIAGTFHLLELARKNKNLKKFIQISTDEVYGDIADQDIDEATVNTPLHGSSYYAASKASADLLVQAAGRTYNLPYLITRTCNNFGSRQHKEKFLPKLINSIKKNQSIGVYGDGSNIREWMYVEDNVKAIYGLTVNEFEGTYNIGSGKRYSNNDVIKIAEKIVGKEINKEYIEDRKGHDKKYALNSSHTPFITNTVTLEKYLEDQLCK